MFAGFAVDGPVVGRFMRAAVPRVIVPVLWRESGLGQVVYDWERGAWRSRSRYAVVASGGATA